MSLINKMLKDLEKRQAYLESDQDFALDGLYSAYDAELESCRQNNVFRLIPLLLIAGIAIYIAVELVTVFNSNKSVSSVVLEEVEQDKNKIVSKQLTLPEKTTNVEYEINKDDLVALKLDTNINVGPSSTDNDLAKIELVRFQQTPDGMNVIVETASSRPEYLVYNLVNPDRTVIEIDNAELSFPIESLEPIAPVVAIRYSMNEHNRLKLVLESKTPLTIQKSTSGEANDKNFLIVAMNHEWKQQANVDKQKIVDNNINEFVDTNSISIDEETVFKGEIIKTPAESRKDPGIEKLYQRAYMLYKNRQLAESMTILNQVLDIDAGHVRGRSTLALILAEQGDYELAQSVINEGLIQYPEEITLVKLLARLYLQQDRPMDAAAVLAAHEPIIAEHTDFYALYAATLQKLQDHNRSARIYRDLLQVNPLQATWWTGLAISLESMQRYEDALFAYQKAMNNPALAGQTKEYVTERFMALSQLIKDESS